MNVRLWHFSKISTMIDFVVLKVIVRKEEFRRNVFSV